MNVIDNAALSKNIQDGIAQAQAAGLALEDHLPSIIDSAVDAELSKLSATVSGVVDAAITRLQESVSPILAEAQAFRAELAAWRELLSRVNLSGGAK